MKRANELMLTEWIKKNTQAHLQPYLEKEKQEGEWPINKWGGRRNQC
jgi:hypothetical protein